MRVLQVGFGNIGREVWRDYSTALADHKYMVTDLIHPAPAGFEWDSQPVDLAVILVDTPSAENSNRLDYTFVNNAVREYAEVATFLLVRSTVSLDYLTTSTYVDLSHRIGFSPEFYGATKYSSRDVLSIDFTVFSENVPGWFQHAIEPDPSRLRIAPAAEVIVAKLTENAFLATKVTFFHELALMCERAGLDFQAVRHVVTSDPRIGEAHSFVEEYGWSSHCFDKDVPAFIDLGDELSLSAAMVEANSRLLNLRRARSALQPSGEWVLPTGSRLACGSICR